MAVFWSHKPFFKGQVWGREHYDWWPEVQHVYTVDEAPEFSPHLGFQQVQGSLDNRLICCSQRVAPS